jgi:glutathione S-transferase
MGQLKIYGAKAFKPELKGIIRDIRAIWMLEELGLKYERVSLDSKKGENMTPEYLKLNPTGKVPTLQDGDFTIFESAAICQYLAEKNSQLIPAKGTPDYFTCVQWCYFAVTNIEPQLSRVFGCDYFYEKNETTVQIRKMALDILGRFFPVLEKMFGDQQTLMKSGFNVADVLLATTLFFCEKSEIYDSYPNIRAYMKRMTDRPAFKRAHALNGE